MGKQTKDFSKYNFKKLEIPEDEPAGLDAWLPTEETEEFYKCNCGDRTKPVCYSPKHRFEKPNV